MYVKTNSSKFTAACGCAEQISNGISDRVIMDILVRILGAESVADSTGPFTPERTERPTRDMPRSSFKSHLVEQ